MSSSTTVDATNPVNEYYKNYNFQSDLPVILCSNYEDVLTRAKSVNSSCILYNKTNPYRQISVLFSFQKKYKITDVFLYFMND